MTSLLSLVLVVALGAPGVRAVGAEAAAIAEAKTQFEAGQLAYDLGRFDEAQASFERAYAARPLPAFLFNIGQCHFQAQRYDRALFFYEHFLELEPRAANRRTVIDLIAETRARKTAQAALVDDTTAWLWVGVAGGAVIGVVGGAALAWAVASNEPSDVVSGRRR